MKTYKLANNITAWIVFIIAAIVYLLTLEPSASFWDCGEFIVSANKLEVGHPPGAPIFMLMGNLFSNLASSPEQVGMMVNAMSAIFSALTILFLFWTITHLAKKLVLKSNHKEMTLWQIVSIIGAGLVGSLAYTFSDTFWYSAVEGEVYAFSSFMTAIVFWLILKWEDAADGPNANRWLILIAYLMGISIAVHLLNLLCIPAIVLVYYFKKYPNPNWKGALLSLLISFGIVAAILYGLIQGVMDVSGWFELFAVNTLGLPYNSGVAIYIIVVFGVIIWGIFETMKNKPNEMMVKISFVLSIALLGIPFLGNNIWIGIFLLAALIAFFVIYKKLNHVALNTILLGLLVITIGYSSYALIVIRSSANTPMDQNSPEDIFTLRDYLAREQYGDTPLFYGHTFAAKNSNPTSKDSRPVYTRVIKEDPSEKDHYEVRSYKQDISYPDRYNMLFTRMHSREERHIQAYGEWTNSKVMNVNGNYVQPSFGDNLKFFFRYQVNFMYWRYFMWNFSGRQNDIQGHGEISKGNWITGIPFIDNQLVGPQSDMPDSIINNKGHNKYYMLPLILGLLGILFQVYSGKKGNQQFWVTFLLFLMTGLAIVVYLNQAPYQPRERDYAYAGSFYAFSIWIGLGVLAIIKGLEKIKLPKEVAAIAGTVITLLVPVQMASQNWDDHDRSGRHLMTDFGHNYLVSCEPNSVIFTYGDNDTFPLWYNQEVLGVRTDVRVCNLSYLNADWYIDQMRMQSYESEPLPINWTRKEYSGGNHDIAYVVPQEEVAGMTVRDALNWIKSDDKRTKISQGKESFDILPTEKIIIPTDSAAIIKSGMIDTTKAFWLEAPMVVDLSDKFRSESGRPAEAKRYLLKSDIMILEMLKNNSSDWSRNFYFAATVGPEQFMRLDPYLRYEGIALRIMPYPAAYADPVNTEKMYDNLMNKYRWGNLQQEGLYIDENAINMCKSFRNLFEMLSSQLIAEGDTVRAKEVMDKCLEVIPDYNVPFNYSGIPLIALNYAEIGEIEKAKELNNIVIERGLRALNWYSRLNDRQYASIATDAGRELYYVGNILEEFYKTYDSESWLKYSEELSMYYERYQQFVNKHSGRR